MVDTKRQGMTRQLDRIGNGAKARARHELVGRDARRHGGFEKALPFGNGEGVGLAGRAEQGHAIAAIGKQISGRA